jgi:hypothetical protein
VKTLIPCATAIAGPVHAEQCGANQVAFVNTAESVWERRPVPRHESEGSAFINLRRVSNPEPPGLETSVNASCKANCGLKWPVRHRRHLRPQLHSLHRRPVLVVCRYQSEHDPAAAAHEHHCLDSMRRCATKTCATVRGEGEGGGGGGALFGLTQF